MPDRICRGCACPNGGLTRRSARPPRYSAIKLESPFRNGSRNIPVWADHQQGHQARPERIPKSPPMLRPPSPIARYKGRGHASSPALCHSRATLPSPTSSGMGEVFERWDKPFLLRLQRRRPDHAWRRKPLHRPRPPGTAGQSHRTLKGGHFIQEDDPQGFRRGQSSTSQTKRQSAMKVTTSFTPSPEQAMAFFAGEDDGPMLHGQPASGSKTKATYPDGSEPRAFGLVLGTRGLLPLRRRGAGLSCRGGRHNTLQRLWSPTCCWARSRICGTWSQSPNIPRARRCWRWCNRPNIRRLPGTVMRGWQDSSTSAPRQPAHEALAENPAWRGGGGNRPSVRWPISTVSRCCSPM